MAWQKDPCPGCGLAKSSVSKECRACFRARTKTAVCPSCGGRKTYDSARCRACQGKESKSHHPCEDCGVIVQRGSKRCSACYAATIGATRIRCIDCNAPLSRGRLTKRCRACNTEYRRSLPRPICSEDGCPREAKARGMCAPHYVKFVRKRPTKEFRGSLLKTHLSHWPCQLCGYRRMRSDIHRLTPGKDGGTYTPGNMVALCARCHREVHRGLSIPPVAPTREEIVTAEIERQLSNPSVM